MLRGDGGTGAVAVAVAVAVARRKRKKRKDRDNTRRLLRDRRPSFAGSALRRRRRGVTETGGGCGRVVRVLQVSGPPPDFADRRGGPRLSSAPRGIEVSSDDASSSSFTAARSPRARARGVIGARDFRIAATADIYLCPPSSSLSLSRSPRDE